MIGMWKLLPDIHVWPAIFFDRAILLHVKNFLNKTSMKPGTFYDSLHNLTSWVINYAMLHLLLFITRKYTITNVNLKIMQMIA